MFSLKYIMSELVVARMKDERRLTICNNKRWKDRCL
jgi:hypothetical protein